jgi:hypothetical protein
MNIKDRISQEPIIRMHFLFTGKIPPRRGRSPKTRVICVIFEPNVSPALISACPTEQEIIELKISEISVPIETKVTPIMRLETPRLAAKDAELLTAILLLITKSIIPIIKTANIMIIPNTNIN